MENNLNVPCPNCSVIPGFINAGELPPISANCITCENTGVITQTHSDLLSLGFHATNDSANYVLYLNKVLNPLETIEVKLERTNGEFVILRTGGGGPNIQSMIDKIGTGSVEPLIDFLLNH